MRLAELDPHLSTSPIGPAAERMDFLCPNCRKRRIIVDFSNALSGDHPTPTGALHIWSAKGDWLDSISLTPSINHEHGNPSPERPCVGWHGFITNGEIT